MDVLSSRILLRPGNLDRSHRFYRGILGLAIYREFGPPDEPGLVFFPGQGLLEVSGHAAGPPGAGRHRGTWQPGPAAPREAAESLPARPGYNRAPGGADAT